MIREAKFIDKPMLKLEGTEIDLPAEELTEALNGLVKACAQLREAVPGLFLKEARNSEEFKQIGIARLVIARYLAALAGDGGAQAILRAQNQIEAFLKGDGSVILPSTSEPGTSASPHGGQSTQVIQLWETPLLDLLMPQWRRIGDPGWVSPLRRHRGNWIEQTFMPVFESFAKRLLLLFLLRGWSLELFRQNRSQARKLFFTAFDIAIVLCGKPRVALRSLYPHLDQACAWAETEAAEIEKAGLVQMDRTRIRDAQRSSGGKGYRGY